MLPWSEILSVFFPVLEQHKPEAELRNHADPEERLQQALDTLCCLSVNNPDRNVKHIAIEKVQRISETLQALYKTRQDRDSWPSRPRTYIILHNLGCVQLMDKFVEDEKTDIWLPYDEETLPKFIKPWDVRKKFLEIQNYVLTSARDLEVISKDVFSKAPHHMHLEGSGDQHFTRVEALGKGSYGVVEKVYSCLSQKYYARKSVLRHRKNNSAALKCLDKELTNLKGLSHRHLVKILGSYTDTEYMAFLMLPVADCNLEDFLKKPGGLTDGDRQDLRTFFGCLAGAVDYLHHSKIRHRDLSLRNILVHKGSVVISDLGSAYKWTGNGNQGSVTQSYHVPASMFYMAPEVARKAPRSSSSDLWSLGVIFMEMTTLLVGLPLAQLKSLLNEHDRANGQPYLWANPKAVTIWLERLQKLNKGPHHDNEPLEWIRSLLNPTPKRRPTSDVLMQDIYDTESFNIFCCIHCQPVFRGRRFGEIETQSIDTQKIREEPYEEDASGIMQDVASTFKEEPPQPIVISSERQSTIETWLADSQMDPSISGALGVDEEEDCIKLNNNLPQSSVANVLRSPFLGKDILLLPPTVEPSQPTTESGFTSLCRQSPSNNTSINTAPQFARDTGLGFFEIDSPSSSNGAFQVLSDSSRSDSDSDVSDILPHSDDDAEVAVPTWKLPLFTGPENRLIQTLDSLPEEQEDLDDKMDELTNIRMVCESTSFYNTGYSVAIVPSGPNPSTAVIPKNESAAEENPLVLVRTASLPLVEKVITAELVDHVTCKAEGDDTDSDRTVSDAAIVPTMVAVPGDPVLEPYNEINTRALFIETSVKDDGPVKESESTNKKASLERPEAQEVLQSANGGPSIRPKKDLSKDRSSQVPKAILRKREDIPMSYEKLSGNQQGPKSVSTEQVAELLQQNKDPESPAVESSPLLNLTPGSTEEKKGMQKSMFHLKPRQKKPYVAQVKLDKEVASIPAKSITREETISSPTQAQKNKQKVSCDVKSWLEQLPIFQMSLNENIGTVTAEPGLEVQTEPSSIKAISKASRPLLDSKSRQKMFTTPPVTSYGNLKPSSTGSPSQKVAANRSNQVLPNMPEPSANLEIRRKNSSTRKVTFADESLLNQKASSRKKRALEPGVSASDYIQNTWEDASSVATSVMSAETKRLLKGLSLNQWLDRDHKLLETFCHKGKAQAVRVLLEKGCNPGKAGPKAKRRQGPINIAVQGASERHNKCVRALIQAGVDVNVVNRSNGKTPLHLAIENPNFKGYEHLICALIAGGADTNKSDDRGDHPIMKVFQGNDIGPLEDHRRKALALLLREASTDVEVTVPGTLNTPLHLAVRRRDAFAVGMLLYKNANVNAKNAAGSTPLLIAAHQFRNPITKDQIDILNILLHTKRIHINEKAGVKEQTALHYAIQAGVAWAVKKLLQHGADPACRDSGNRDAHALARDHADKWTPEDRDNIMRQLQTRRL